MIGYLLTGKSNPEIAWEVGMTERSVKAYCARIYKRLGLTHNSHPRVELAYLWNCEIFQIGLRELGLLEDYAHRTV